MFGIVLNHKENGDPMNYKINTCLNHCHDNNG